MLQRLTHPRFLEPSLFLGLMALSLVGLGLFACGGSGELEDDPADFDAAVGHDTGYDATAILERLTDSATYDDPEAVATLAADFNSLKDSLDFQTAKKQAKALSVEFRTRPMRASMAAAVMDKWNEKPPAEITSADLEQAWAIRRREKKTDEQLAREHELRLQDRLERQEEVKEERVQKQKQREEAVVDTMALWIESYRKATVEGRGALARVQASLADPSQKGDLGPACKALFHATQDMDGGIFRAPDPGIKQPLTKAWERYRVASRSCMKGEMAYLTTRLAEGRAAMANVRRILQKYDKTLE